MEHTQYFGKKKKKRTRIRMWLLLLAVVAIGIGCFLYEKKKEQAEQTDFNARENVELLENQHWLYLQIENMVGNEMQAVKEASDGETETYLIPVGTQVVTKLGSVTTFSRLTSGDRIACLTQETDGETVILKIWIEE